MVRNVLLNEKTMSIPLRRDIAIHMHRELLIKLPLFKLASKEVLGMLYVEI